MATMTPPSPAREVPSPTALGNAPPNGSLVVDLAEVNRANIAIVGGKGANLGEMMRAELPVPPGFVLTIAA